MLLYLNYRKEGAIFGSKRGDPCGITEFLSPDPDEKPYFSKINVLGANYPPKPLKEGEREAEEEPSDPAETTEDKKPEPDEKDGTE